MIHPTAIVDRRAELHETVIVGPFCVIDADVRIGAGCRLYQNVYVTGHTVIGEGCELHPGVIVGHLPQDVKFKGEVSYCRIGARTVIREYATIHRATGEQESTEVGDDCFLLGGIHIGHNCEVGNRVTMVNGSKLAGHCRVADRVTFGADGMAHQFVRIGELAMIGAGGPVAMDVPPFMLTDHDGFVAGLNAVGLRRADVPREEALELRTIFRTLYREGLPFREAVVRAAEGVRGEAGRRLVAFLQAPSRRGILGPPRKTGPWIGSERDSEGD
ncbi:MAG: Acyl-[acyl-carrier-protein]--UDP-N-acetylglucosamine O-acyltransferase [Phycisphaerae bacterium]|nr:Acyl-[acyl-carrier-protein]--UDP-N-acetylglucosamine O-acyltransferase [Phycisphaerae bacterium]